jgi:hypothetical protein
MSVVSPTILSVVELTSGQRRTFEGLIRAAPTSPVSDGLAEATRDRLELELASAGITPGGGEEIWLGKQRLNDRQRCEGLFEASLLREGPPFAHSLRTGSGALFHKAIELDVATERQLDPLSLCERAAQRLEEVDPSFERFWGGLDLVGRAELATDAGRHLSLFRDSFPPIPRRWAPQPELPVRVRLAGGRVVLSGAPDLVLGRTRRLAIDFKSGRAWPEHPEDMRFYALLLLLRTGLPPYRVATFFLDSGEWQAEDVSEATVQRAADRVVDSATVAARLAGGTPPELSPGPHCGRCARREVCPVAQIPEAVFPIDQVGSTR